MTTGNTVGATAARVLLAGPDTIHLSLEVEISDELRAKLETEKAVAQEADKVNAVHCPEWLGPKYYPTGLAVGMASCWRPRTSGSRFWAQAFLTAQGCSSNSAPYSCIPIRRGQLDNGPEFSSQALDAWAHQHRVKLVFSRPGTPTDNPFIEAFNSRLSRLRQECLNQQWFYSLDEARTLLEEWRQDYNTVRPHTALGNQTPAAFHAAWAKQQTDRETG